MKHNHVKLFASLCASACMALAATGAQADTITFSQTGFNDGAKVQGFFQGQDLNHDGHIAGNEIFNFSAVVIGGLYDGISFDNKTRYQPFIDYVIGSNAVYAIGAYSGIQIGYNGGAGGGEVYDGFHQYPSSTTSDFIHVTGTSPVPEPESWALMLAGLVLLPTLLKRKKAV